MNSSPSPFSRGGLYLAAIMAAAFNPAWAGVAPAPSQQAYIKAFNATGVNGDPNNGSASVSGAAFVFSGVVFHPTLALVPDGSAGQFIRFTGVPGGNYRMQRAATLSGPWDTLDTLTVPASGLLEFHDTTAPPAQAFYRTAQP